MGIIPHPSSLRSVFSKRRTSLPKGNHHRRCRSTPILQAPSSVTRRDCRCPRLSTTKIQRCTHNNLLINSCQPNSSSSSSTTGSKLCWLKLNRRVSQHLTSSSLSIYRVEVAKLIPINNYRLNSFLDSNLSNTTTPNKFHNNSLSRSQANITLSKELSKE